MVKFFAIGMHRFISVCVPHYTSTVYKWASVYLPIRFIRHTSVILQVRVYVLFI